LDCPIDTPVDTQGNLAVFATVPAQNVRRTSGKQGYFEPRGSSGAGITGGPPGSRLIGVIGPSCADCPRAFQAALPATRRRSRARHASIYSRRAARGITA
jgi:hypothetical protein